MALINIDSQKQLFVDDYLIESMKNCAQVLNRAEKAGDNPILRPDGRTGRIDSLRFGSPCIEGERIIEAYLPADYDQSARRYAVAYYHGARHHRTLEKMDIALDNIISRRVRPIIVVFLPPLSGGDYAQYVGPGRDHYAQIFTEEIVPLVDATYRTIATRENRANVGFDPAL